MKKFTKKYSFFYYTAIVLIYLGFLIYLFLILHPTFNDFSFMIDEKLSAALGNSIAGIVGSLFSLAGILLIIETLRSQNNMSNIQRFESKYFELIKIHRNNVDNLRKLYSTGSTWEGNQVFIEIYEELKEIIDSINKLTTKYNIELSELDRGGIAFTILYFGTNTNAINILKDYFKRHYPVITDEQLSNLIEILNNSRNTKLINKYRFVGHQMRLGHYYRHLYQTVKYVFEQEFLTKTIKYDYVKTLRAQLSTFEQSLLFFNSLSVLGKNWRIFNFIEYFQLIKNLPPEFTMDFNPKTIYPQINFEYEE